MCVLSSTVLYIVQLVIHGTDSFNIEAWGTAVWVMLTYTVAHHLSMRVWRNWYHVIAFHHHSKWKVVAASKQRWICASNHQTVCSQSCMYAASQYCQKNTLRLLLWCSGAELRLTYTLSKHPCCFVVVYVLCPGDQLEANRKSSFFVNLNRQNSLPTRKAFVETGTTCIWLTLSYEAWYCTSLLKKICMLVLYVTAS